MSVKINIPSYLQPYTSEQEVVEVSGSTAGECLDRLATGHGTLPIFDLSQPPEKVYSKDMKIVGDKEEMLKIVGRWAKSPLKHPLRLAAGRYQVHVPGFH